MQNYDVNLSHIDVEGADTDEVLLQKAKDHLPAAVKGIAKKAAEEFWNEIQRGIGGSGIFRMNVSREQFIAEKSGEIAANLTASEKNNLVETIVRQLKADRDQTREAK